MTPHPVRPDRVVSAISIFIAALCAGVLDRPARCDEPVSILWRNDYGAALEEARAANRLLWIQFTGPWCPNCTRMEQDSFPHAAIIEHSARSFLPVKLRSDENEQLVAALGLTAIPATIVVTPNRDIVGFHQGYLGPGQLDALLSDCLARNPLEGSRQARADSTETSAGNPAVKADKPRSEPALALGGFCTVSLIEDRKLVKGHAEHAIEHQGRIYRFSSLAASERFRQEPAKYLPWNEGSCPVTQVEEGLPKPGEPRWGVLYSGRLFVCASEEHRRRFVADPAHFAAALALDQDSPPAQSQAQPEQGQ